MRTSYLHLAGLRLGYRRSDDPTVFERVVKQWKFAIDYAIDQRTAFVLIAGELFESPEVEPDALHVALTELKRLAEKNILAIAVRGQRDGGNGSRPADWYELLARQGLLCVLSPSVSGEDRLELTPWDRRAWRGGYIDLMRCRVFGLPAPGLLAGPLLHALAEAVAAIDNREADFRIILLPTVVEHFSDPFPPHLTFRQLLQMRRVVDYVALGGVPHRYEAEQWAYNPGDSGFLHVSVDTAVQPKHTARHIVYPPPLEVQRSSIRVLATSREQLYDQVLEEVLAAVPDDRSGVRRDAVSMTARLLAENVDAGQLYERLFDLARAQAPSP